MRAHKSDRIVLIVLSIVTLVLAIVGITVGQDKHEVLVRNIAYNVGDTIYPYYDEGDTLVVWSTIYQIELDTCEGSDQACDDVLNRHSEVISVVAFWAGDTLFPDHTEQETLLVKSNIYNSELDTCRGNDSLWNIVLHKHCIIIQ